MIAFDRVVDAFRIQGLIVQDHGVGRASAQAPNHSPADRSVSIRDIGEQVLIHSHSDATEDVLAAVGLTLADLFDSPRGITYSYPDGRRVLRSPDKRFWQEGNTRGSSLFHVEQLTSASGGTVYVTEGEKDVLALESASVAAVCSAGGAGKAHLFDWTPLHGRHVVVVADRDEPGRKHASQVAALLDGKAASVKVVIAKVGKDAADHVAAGCDIGDFIPVDLPHVRLLAALAAAAETAKTLPFEEALDAIYRHLDELAPRQEEAHGPKRLDTLLDAWWDWLDAPPQQVRTIATPWPELDDLLAGGLQPGRSYLFAGRPGSGKSLALTNAAAYAAKLGHPGVLFSVEMGTMEIVSRVLAAGGPAEYGQVSRRRVDDFNRGRIAAYASDAQAFPLWISDQTPITIDQIRSQARDLKRANGLDFVAVDYVQLLRSSDQRLPRERQIAEISWGLKTMAKELDVAVISACQLNRGSAKEKRPPTIAELRESGSLEQDSDVVILIHHDLAEGQPTGDVEFIVGKNRTGKLSRITLQFKGYQARIG